MEKNNKKLKKIMPETCLGLKILCLLIVLYASVSMVSSAEFDNVKSDLTLTKGDTLTIGDKQIEYTDLWTTYKPIQVKNMFGLGSTLFTGAITKHSSSCSSDCESEIEVYQKDKEVLIKDIRFKRFKDDAWSDYAFDKYSIYISNKDADKEIDVYENVCEIDIKNGTEICNYVITGKQTIKEPIWEQYNIGDIVDGGTYKVKIVGDKRPKDILDWQINVQGAWLEEWAVWGSMASLTNRLWTYLTMNSTTIIDSTGNITWTNDGTIIDTGKINNSLKFDGVNDRITGGTFAFNQNSYSIATWFKTNTTTNDNYIIGTNWAASTVVGIRLENKYLQFFEAISGTFHLNATNTSKIVNDNNWHHVVAIKDTAKSRAYLYIDGVLSANVSQSNYNIGSRTYDIGSARGSAGAWQAGWNGSMDEFAIWNRTLTTSEIQYLYNYGIGSAYPFIGTQYATLLSPANNTNFTTNTSNFVCEANLTTAGIKNITLTINSTTSTTPNYGGHYEFDGVDDYINSNSNSLGNFTYQSNFTLSAWVNILDNSGGLLFTKKSTGHSAGYYVSVFGTTLNLGVSNGTASATTTSNSFNSIQNSWHHVVWTYNNRTVSFYVDGINYGTYTNSLNQNSIITNTVNFAIGRRASATNFEFNGSIDEVRIFNKSLSEAEITSLYNQGREEILGSVATANLVTYYDLGKNNLDDVKGTNDGTAYGGAYGKIILNESVTMAQGLTQNWTCSACDSDGDCGTATETRTFNVDSILPNITITGGNGTFNYGRLNYNHTINYTISDTNIDKCWYSTIDSFENGFDNWINTEYANRVTSWKSKGDYSILINSFTPEGTYPLTKHNVVLNKEISLDYNVNAGAGQYIAIYVCPNGTVDSIVGCDLVSSFGGGEVGIGSKIIDTSAYFGQTKSILFRRQFCFGGCGTFNSLYIDNIIGLNRNLINCSLTHFNEIILGNNDNVMVYANDTLGNLNSSFVEWDYMVIENNRSYTQQIALTTLDTFNLSLTTDGTQIPIVYLNYNGSSYLTTLTSGVYTKTLPMNATGTNIPIYWTINYGTNIFNTTISYQNVTIAPILNITSSACSAGLSMVYNFTFADENNLTRLSNYTVKYNLKYGISDNLGAVSYGVLNNINQIIFCINTTQYPEYLIGYGELEYERVDYTSRRYYIFENTRISNQTNNITLISLPNADSTSFLIEVRNPTLQPYKNNYTALLRWYPDRNAYEVVEMGILDDKGQTVKKVKVEDVDYRIGVYNKDGTLVYLASPIRMVCLVSPCSYILTIRDTSSMKFNELYNFESLLTYEDFEFKLIYNDPTQSEQTVELKVYKLTGTHETEVCSANSTAFTGILICNVSGQTGLLKAIVYRTASPTYILAQLIEDLSSTIFQGTFGLFLQFLISATLIFLGIVSPVVGIILGVLSLILGVFIFKTVTYPIFIGIAIVGGIVIHFMRRSQP